MAMAGIGAGLGGFAQGFANVYLPYMQQQQAHEQQQKTALAQSAIRAIESGRLDPNDPGVQKVLTAGLGKELAQSVSEMYGASALLQATGAQNQLLTQPATAEPMTAAGLQGAGLSGVGALMARGPTALPTAQTTPVPFRDLPVERRVEVAQERAGTLARSPLLLGITHGPGVGQLAAGAGAGGGAASPVGKLIADEQRLADAGLPPDDPMRIALRQAIARSAEGGARERAFEGLTPEEQKQVLLRPLVQLGPSAPEAGERTRIAEREAGIEALDALENLLPLASRIIGPVAGRIATTKERLGGMGLNENEIAFLQQITTITNETIRAITGAQLSPGEAQRIMAQLPNVRLTIAANRVRIRQTRRNLIRLQAAQRRVLEQSGIRNVPQMTTGEPGASPPAARPALPPGAVQLKGGGTFEPLPGP